MITLTYKQAADIRFISGMAGGKSISLAKVDENQAGDVLHAYMGDRIYLLPPRGRLKEVINGKPRELRRVFA